MEINQNRPMCSWCGAQVATDLHHLVKRSLAPELADDPKNKLPLCRPCHEKTEINPDFLNALREIFFDWNPKSYELFVRAQATIDAMLDGKDIEYLTPHMTDAYLQLAGGQYAYVSEKLASLEIQEACFYKDQMAIDEKLSLNKIAIWWKTTPSGQEMIDLKRKEKVLEKLQSNFRERLRRFNAERFTKT